MNEKEMRALVVEKARSYLGCKESDGTHKAIIDLYNSHKPLARGYPVKYDDAWCATFVSAVSIACGITDIMPTECGCEAMIKLYKNHGSSKWQEDESVPPKPGDVVFYDWQDSGAGDNKGAADHVGIVSYVSGNVLKVIEGNYSNSVKERTLSVNGKYLRGYGIPAYHARTREEDDDMTPEKLAEMLPEAFAILAKQEAAPWAQEALDWCKEKGYMVGDGTGNQQPMKPLLRQEAAQLIKNIMES